MRVHAIDATAIDIPLTVVTRLRTEGGLVTTVYNGVQRLWIY